MLLWGTLFYLFIPYFIFFLGWLKLVYAILASGLLAYGLYVTAKQNGFSKPNFSGITKNKKDLLIVLAMFLMAVVWTAFSGIGGVGYQNPDYIKHNAIFNDLVSQPWPTYYSQGTAASNGMPTVLIYYLAYYLPAALFGKGFGWEAANNFHFIWACVGFFLSFYWFFKLVKHKSLWVIVIFILAGGLDIIGHQFIASKFVRGSEHLEWWALHFQYSANSSLLVWVPQHAIAGWLATSLLMDQFLNSESCKHYGLIAASTVFWSPFVALGIAPFVLFTIIRNRFKEILNISNLVIAPIIVAIFGLYYSSLINTVPWSSWGRYDILANWPTLVLFLMIECGLYIYLCFLSTGIVQGKNKWFMIVATLVLCILPFYRFGLYNDLSMRASIPALYVVWIFVAQALFNVRDGRSLAVSHVLKFVFFIGAFTGLAELTRSLENYSIQVPNQQYIVKVPAIMPLEVAKQYTGDPTSFFFQHLAAEPEL